MGALSSSGVNTHPASPYAYVLDLDGYTIEL